VTHRWRGGLTLVEVLIVTAIIAILAAVTVSVTQRAKARAHVTVTQNQLRQIATAAGIYESDQGVHPILIRTLVESRYLNPNMAVSPLDPVSKGFANEYYDTPTTAPSIHSFPPLTFRQSYVELGVMTSTSFFERIRKSEAGGWLVDASNSNYFAEDVQMPLPVTKYVRLCFDGSVQHRGWRRQTFRDLKVVWIGNFSDETIETLVNTR